MAERKDLIRTTASQTVDAFLAKLAALPAARVLARRGRLLFALDATLSRQPAWDQAMAIQAEMFAAASDVGGIDIQLAWFRGFGEFQASPWQTDSTGLLAAMTGVECRGGKTQIGRMLRHALAEDAAAKLAAMVFVGDCVEEDADALCDLAGRMGLRRLPLFLFQDGDDADAQALFPRLARLSGGAWCRLDAGAARALRDLLRAVAVYAAGGAKALADLSRRQGGAALLLTRQMLPGGGQ